MKVLKIIGNWLIFLLIIGCFVELFKIQWRRPLLSDHLRAMPTMTGLQVVIFSMAISFAWTELKLARHKPLNCLKCMTGWVALMLAFTFHVQFWYMYLPVGVFVGAVFEGIKMRWL